MVIILREGGASGGTSWEKETDRHLCILNVYIKFFRPRWESEMEVGHTGERYHSGMIHRRRGNEVSTYTTSSQ